MRRPSALQLLGRSAGRGAGIRSRRAQILSARSRLFDRDLDKSLFSMFEPVVPNRAQLAWADWMCGYPDRARNRADEALQLALRLNRPFSIAFALQYKVSVEHLCRTYANTDEITPRI